jgi:hypothetical protein
MGVDKFYVYSGRVETLPCTIWKYVFNDINFSQSYQFFAGTNERYNEVWWFYCSADSTRVNRYVIFNYVDNTWAYGTLERTAWLDSSLREFPTAAGYEGTIYYHEAAIDDGTTNPPRPIEAFVESADIDIGDGHNFMFVWRLLPDLTFEGSTANTPQATFTVSARKYPGSAYHQDPSGVAVSPQDFRTTRSYAIQQFTDILHIRARGRQVAIKISSDQVGVQWQLGVPRIDMRLDGRK